jgi:BASS family bile acid:Na+ symporter
MSSILLPLGLAVLMFVVGLDLSRDGFVALTRRPIVVAAGLAAQMVGLPALALLIALALRLPPHLTLGLAIVAAAPGGVTAAYATSLARGDVALSVLLTLITSALAGLSVPIVLAVAASVAASDVTPVDLPVLRSLAAIGATTIVPILLAALLVSRRPDLALRIRPAARRIASVVFAAIIVGAVVAQWRLILAELAMIGPAVFLLVALAMGLGVATGLAVEQDAARARSLARTLAIECGLQNVALALLVVDLIGQPALGRVATVYAFAMNVVLVLFLASARWSSRDLSAIKSDRAPTTYSAGGGS